MTYPEWEVFRKYQLVIRNGWRIFESKDSDIPWNKVRKENCIGLDANDGRVVK